MIPFRLGPAAGLAGTLTALPAAAQAHHPMGGGTPETWWAGLLSGLGHPIIELDHFVFIVAIALIVRLMPRPILMGGLLVLGTALGAVAHWIEAPVPAGELAIAVSLIAAGVWLAMQRSAPRPDMLGGLLLIGGTFHGHAYGETIVGAEPTPVGFYLAGFALSQLGLVAAGQAAAALAEARLGAHARRGVQAAGVAVAVMGTVYAAQLVPVA